MTWLPSCCRATACAWRGWLLSGLRSAIEGNYLRGEKRGNVVEDVDFGAGFDLGDDVAEHETLFFVARDGGLERLGLVGVFEEVGEDDGEREVDGVGLFDERTDRAVENRAGIHEDPLQRDVEIGEERGETRRDVDLVLHVELGALNERVIHAEGGVFAEKIDFVGEDVREAGDERRPGRGAGLLVALLNHSPANGHLFEERDVLERLVDQVERAELKHAERGGQRLHGDDLIAEQRQSAINRRKQTHFERSWK